jgi:hypothetical protein
MQVLLLLCVAAAAERELEPERGAHVSHGPLLTYLLGALAAPASGFFPGPVESVVPVQVGPRAQAPLAARPVVNPVADKILRVDDFVDPFPRSEPGVFRGTNLLAAAEKKVTSAGEQKKLDSLLKKEQLLAQRAVDFRAQLELKDPMKEMMFKKLTALEDELTVIKKEQKFVENSRAGKKPDDVRVLEKKCRMLDSRMEVLNEQAGTLRDELGPGFAGSLERDTSRYSVRKATLVKLTQVEKQQESLNAEIEQVRAKLGVRVGDFPEPPEGAV